MRIMRIFSAALFLVALAASPAPAAGQSSVGSALADMLHAKGVIDDASYNDVKSAGAQGGDQAADRKLIEVLHAKGVIDDASYKKLTELAAVETAPQATPAAAAKPAEGGRPVEAALAAVEEGVARLAGDKVKLKIGTWTQLGYSLDSSGSNASPLPGSSTPVGKSGNQFYARFARLYFNFTVAEKMGFRLMLDGTGAPPLKDAFFWDEHIPYHRVTVGQFLTPFTESWRAPFDLPMINYAYTTQLMNFGFRDTGLMLSGKYAATLGGRPLGGGYQVAVVNGVGINKSDDNSYKDVTGRAWINPFLPGLTLCGEWYVGHTDKNTTDNTKAAFHAHDLQRWGVELEYSPAFLAGLSLRGEYLSQRRFFTAANMLKVAGDPASGIADASPAPKARYYHSDGWYVSALYRISGLGGTLRYLNGFEPTFRYDTMDEDVSAPGRSRSRYTIGLNYWLNKYARVMLNYETVHADGGLSKLSFLSDDLTGKRVLTTNVQIWF